MRPLALVLASLVFAGCLAPASPAPAAGPDGARVLPWGLEDCRFVIGLVRFDPSLAEDLLPEGFAFALGDGLPLPVEAEPLARATLGVEAFDCARGAGLRGTVGPLAYGSLYFNVLPPPELSAGEDAGHYLKLAVLVPDADRREALEAAGADVTGGAVDLADAALGRSGTMVLDTVGDFRFEAVWSQRGGGVEGFRFREFTPTADGRLVLWDGVASRPDTLNGRGTLEVPAGSLPARLGGGTTLEVGMFGGTYTFAEASTTLPPPR